MSPEISCDRAQINSGLYLRRNLEGGSFQEDDVEHIALGHVLNCSDDLCKNAGSLVFLHGMCVIDEIEGWETFLKPRLELLERRITNKVQTKDECKS